MDSSWTRSFKSKYRREPVLSFVATVGAVNVAMGGVSAHWGLMSLGLGVVGMAIALRWWQLRTRKPTVAANRAPVYALPSVSARPTLPLLSIPKKNPPRHQVSALIEFIKVGFYRHSKRECVIDRRDLDHIHSAYSAAGVCK